MQLSSEMRILDVGCGVGGPAREMCRFIGAKITGINSNQYQISRAQAYSNGMQPPIEFCHGDFMNMPFLEGSFDAVYAFAATCHAPSLSGVYTEIYRVLKPGGVFGVSEWVLTNQYDSSIPEHRNIREGIEYGNGIANMPLEKDALAAIEAAGFVLEYCEDAANNTDIVPWYYPVAGDWAHLQRLSDIFLVFRVTWLGLLLIHGFLFLLETIGLLPEGTKRAADVLAAAGKHLTEGGKKGIFSPTYVMVARKPRCYAI